MHHEIVILLLCMEESHSTNSGCIHLLTLKSFRNLSYLEACPDINWLLVKTRVREAKSRQYLIALSHLMQEKVNRIPKRELDGLSFCEPRFPQFWQSMICTSIRRHYWKFESYCPVFLCVLINNISNIYAT